jgi:hypothetical protein
MAVAVLWLTAGTALAQSAGMARLLHHGESKPPRESSAQHEARMRAERHRAEGAAAERTRETDHSNLSPDERKRLRQNLYELSREMYQGG